MATLASLFFLIHFSTQVGGHCTGGQKLAVSVKLPKVEKPMEGAQTPMAGGKDPWEWSGAFTAPGHTTWTLAKKNGKYADSSMKVYIAETDECGAHGIDEVKAKAKVRAQSGVGWCAGIVPSQHSHCTASCAVAVSSLRTCPAHL